MKNTERICFGLAYLFILALGVSTILRILAGTDGFFLYAIDDAYIHLAMSEEILRGNYGVNSNEFSAASSSIIFPFLLAPAAAFWFHDKVPLVINFGCLFVTLEAARALLRHLGFLTTAAMCATGALLAVAFVIFSFAFGVAFTGMEHSAHVAAVAVTFCGLAIFLDEKRIHWWFIVALVAGPLFRFEGLALSLTVCGILAIRGAWLPFMLTTALIIGTVTAFVYFLVKLGLPPLPSSILMKSNAAVSGSGGNAAAFVVALLKNAGKMLLHPTGVVLGLVATGILAAFVLRPEWRRLPLGSKPLMGLAVAGMIVGHAAGGSFGYLERYETYIVVGAILGCVYLGRDLIGGILRRPYGAIQVAIVGSAILCAVGVRYAYTTINSVPLSAQNMYQMNYQMHRFLVGHHKRAVAVNDLGWTTFRNPDYVLDLWGLGSDKARKLRQAGDTSGLIRLVTDAKIDLLISYVGVVGDQLPPGWSVVGRMHLGGQRLSPVYSWIEFTTTSERAAPALREELISFSRTMPAGVKLEIFDSSHPPPPLTPSMMR